MNVLPRLSSLVTPIVPAVLVDELVHQGKANSAAFERSAPCAFDPMEAFENPRQFVARNSGAGIADDQLRSRSVVGGAHLDGNLAVERELEGIGNEIEDDLFPHFPIDIDRLRKLGT